MRNHKKPMFLLFAMMLLLGTQHSYAQKKKKNDFAGAWMINKISYSSADENWMSDDPPSGMILFSEGYFSVVLIPRTEERPMLSNESSDEDRLKAYSNFIANAGTYEIMEDNMLKMNIHVAKSPNAMASEDSGYTCTYAVRDDRLVLTLKEAWAPEGGEITYQLKRME